jgi:hypothetical protein
MSEVDMHFSVLHFCSRSSFCTYLPPSSLFLFLLCFVFCFLCVPYFPFSPILLFLLPSSSTSPSHFFLFLLCLLSLSPFPHSLSPAPSPLCLPSLRLRRIMRAGTVLSLMRMTLLWCHSSLRSPSQKHGFWIHFLYCYTIYCTASFSFFHFLLF